MGRARIRASKPTGGRGSLLKAGLAATAAAVAVVLVGLLLLSREPFDRSHLTARGTILDARIVQTGAREGWPTGRIMYRIEALVRYSADGGTLERWLPVVYNYPREYMVARLARRPEACEVFWAPRHPENAKCRFYDDLR